MTWTQYEVTYYCTISMTVYNCSLINQQYLKIQLMNQFVDEVKHFHETYTMTGDECDARQYEMTAGFMIMRAEMGVW